MNNDIYASTSLGFKATSGGAPLDQDQEEELALDVFSTLVRKNKRLKMWLIIAICYCVLQACVILSLCIEAP